MNSHFKRLYLVGVSVKEMNELLTEAKRSVKIVRYEEYQIGCSNDIFIEVGMRFLRVTCKYKGRVGTYICDMAIDDVNEANRKCSSGLDAFIKLRNSLGKANELIPKIVKDEDLLLGKNIDPFSTGPVLYFNPEYNNKGTYAYGYDMNSAYAYAMLGDMPDTRECKSVNISSFNKGIVEENQIGFDSIGELVPTGEWAMFRFPKMPSPFKKFVEKYYTIKSTTTSDEDKAKAKNALNHSVGFFQRINPFIRSTIVSRANNIIRSLIDENTLYCNTDSIVSKTPRSDLKIGLNVGEWKLEHKGIFKYKDMSYQWGNSKPSYRGIPKSWFPKNYDLLRDDLPMLGNEYMFDKSTLRVVRRKDYEKEILQQH